ncbi:hypothetical protein CRE_13575 [Caenorhabditis remanei]|uniref:Uncharacterized protein n=1 Tax=Caenorhabditis remanei TaxID=31234 RepID=E3N1B2_CAERE|nr:hypothetical protein CRE_13575 [Caenorhabditis remanei]
MKKVVGEKSKQSAESPFLLEITPEKLEIPPDGLLEVTIKNPTRKTLYLSCYFDSFYFLVDFNDVIWSQRGDTPSGAHLSQDLEPGEYPKWLMGCAKCDTAFKTRKYRNKKSRSNPKTNIFYNLERPEGILSVNYECGDEVSSTRTFDLYLKEETERYKDLKEAYLKIRQNQKRRERWGESLLNTPFDGTRRVYKKEEDLTRVLDSTDEFKFESPYETPEGFWGKVIANRCSPLNLEAFDAVSDKEIQKIKMEKRAQYFWLIFIVNEEDLQKEVEVCWGTLCTCQMPRLKTREKWENLVKGIEKLETKTERKKALTTPQTVQEKKKEYKESIVNFVVISLEIDQ